MDQRNRHAITVIITYRYEMGGASAWLTTARQSIKSWRGKPTSTPNIHEKYKRVDWPHLIFFIMLQTINGKGADGKKLP